MFIHISSKRLESKFHFLSSFVKSSGLPTQRPSNFTLTLGPTFAALKLWRSIFTLRPLLACSFSFTKLIPLGQRVVTSFISPPARGPDFSLFSRVDGLALKGNFAKLFSHRSLSSCSLFLMPLPCFPFIGHRGPGTMTMAS